MGLQINRNAAKTGFDTGSGPLVREIDSTPAVSVSSAEGEGERVREEAGVNRINDGLIFGTAGAILAPRGQKVAAFFFGMLTPQVLPSARIKGKSAREIWDGIRVDVRSWAARGPLKRAQK